RSAAADNRTAPASSLNREEKQQPTPPRRRTWRSGICPGHQPLEEPTDQDARCAVEHACTDRRHLAADLDVVTVSHCRAAIARRDELHVAIAARDSQGTGAFPVQPQRSRRMEMAEAEARFVTAAHGTDADRYVGAVSVLAGLHELMTFGKSRG